MDAEKKKAVTARELPQMVLIKPTIVEDTVVISFPEEKGIPSFTVPLDPPESTLADWKHLEQVMVWSDACDGYIVQAIPNQEGVAVDPSEVLSGYLDRPVHLVLKGPSPRPVKPTDTHASLSTVTRFQDGYPLLVATMESLQSVEEQTWFQGARDACSPMSIQRPAFRTLQFPTKLSVNIGALNLQLPIHLALASMLVQGHPESSVLGIRSRS
ncbi:hypothetical protein FRC03_007365 [Tulasnella sp. 419]|nr:hypothetical protein FRC03_007365 [Tulasnella sp. 419]